MAARFVSNSRISRLSVSDCLVCLNAAIALVVVLSLRILV